MSDKTKNDDIQSLANELIEKLSVLANKSNGKNPIAPNGDIILEDDPGKWIKIDNKIFYQMIYTDVKQLKKDSDTILSQYLDDIKPTLKSVDDNVKDMGKSIKCVEKDVEDLKKNKPKSFRSWISEKGQMAESSGNIFKFLFYALVIIWILSTSLPSILRFLASFAGIETGG